MYFFRSLNDKGNILPYLFFTEVGEDSFFSLFFAKKILVFTGFYPQL